MISLQILNSHLYGLDPKGLELKAPVLGEFVSTFNKEISQNKAQSNPNGFSRVPLNENSKNC